MPLISTNQLEKLVDFFNILEKNNIRYIVLRGYYDLPDRIRTDLDIACHPDDQYKFYEFAKTHLEYNSYPYIGQINGKEILYWDFFISDKTNTNQNIRMDLYNGIFWFHGKAKIDDRTYYPDDNIFQEYIFNNRIKNDWFYIPSNEIRLIFDLLRCIYDKRKPIGDIKVGTKYRNEI